MKLLDWIDANTKKLGQVGISTARLDCLVLLEDALDKNRSWLLANPEYELAKETLNSLQDKILRRSKHEPLAYIRGKNEFYGREYAVNAHTLQPRPETETMIELLKDLVESKKLKVKSLEVPIQRPKTRQDSSAMTIVDIGTGSGCIAITVKRLFPQAHVIAIDIDNQCLKLASQNAKTHHTNVDFLKGNLLKPLSNIKYQESNIILLANLPYVPDSYTINQAAMHEPRHAIFGGDDGLDYYRSLFGQVQSLNTKPRPIFTEAMPPQHKELERIAQQNGYQLTKAQDFIQVFTSI